MYLFDPVQIKEYGKCFYESTNHSFKYRYQKGTKLFGLWQARYVPYGPVCSSKDDFVSFLDHARQIQFSKVIVSLPLVLDSDEKAWIRNEFTKRKYREIEYRILDSETIVIDKKEYKPNSRTRQYIRKGEKIYDVNVLEKVSDEDLQIIHDIYAGQTHIPDFNPKSLDAFRVVADNGLTAIARDNETGIVHGFLMGYIHKMPLNYKEGIFINVLRLIFTAITLEGRDNHIGYLIHGKLFDAAFDQYKVDSIDFHGADRSKGRSYVSFKEKWGGHYVKYPGSFKKINLL